MTVSTRSIPVTRTSSSRFSEALRDSAGFGDVFSDHVLVADYADGAWREPAIVPYGPLPQPPAPVCASAVALVADKAPKTISEPFRSRPVRRSLLAFSSSWIWNAPS